MKRLILIILLSLSLTSPAQAGWFSGGGSCSTAGCGISLSSWSEFLGIVEDTSDPGSLMKRGTSTIENATSNTDYLPPINPQGVVGSSLSASGYSGLSIPGTSLTAGSVYYYGSSGLALAKADASGTMGACCIAVSTTSCMIVGVYKFSASQSWTAGNSLYVSAASAGAIVTSAPSTSTNIVQKIGKALANDTILFLPSLDLGTVQ